MFNFILIVHTLAGLIGLIVGPVAMFARKRNGLHTVSGTIYFYLMTLVCISGGTLAVLNWERSWWLLFVSIFSYGFCLRGYLAEKRRPSRWLKKHITGMLGSYVAMSTAFIVVNVGRVEILRAVPPVFFWILPTLVAFPLIKKTVLSHSR